jgi:ArsR family transcriptional regulator, arsenate/arsenite/antimonite-responsive transcriptional repressor
MMTNVSMIVNTFPGGSLVARRAETGVGTVEACCASVLQAPLDEADAEELANAFAALADPVRLRLLSLIAATDEVCSCDLQEPLQRSQPTVSHHTKALVDAGLIVGEKRGRWVWWRVVPERLEMLRAALG